jgi:hypothetical protein
MSRVITPKPVTEMIVLRRRPNRSASAPNTAAPMGRPTSVVAKTSEVKIAAVPGSRRAGWK